VSRWEAPASSGGPEFFDGGITVSIVRVGLAETKHFAEGYDAIFRKKTPVKKEEEKKEEASAETSKGKKKKKKSGKKK
jgi:hypothetical protein